MICLYAGSTILLSICSTSREKFNSYCVISDNVGCCKYKTHTLTTIALWHVFYHETTAVGEIIANISKAYDLDIFSNWVPQLYYRKRICFEQVWGYFAFREEVEMTVESCNQDHSNLNKFMLSTPLENRMEAGLGGGVRHKKGLG